MRWNGSRKTKKLHRCKCCGPFMTDSKTQNGVIVSWWSVGEVRKTRGGKKTDREDRRRGAISGYLNNLGNFEVFRSDLLFTWFIRDSATRLKKERICQRLQYTLFHFLKEQIIYSIFKRLKLYLRNSNVSISFANYF